MIFLGRRTTGLAIKIWIGGPATGKVTLRYMNDGGQDPADPGLIVTPKAVHGGGAAAFYDVPSAMLGHWLHDDGDPLPFRVELEAFSVSAQPMGWLSLSQSGARLAAQNNRHPANGAHAPFGDVAIGNISSGSSIVRDFGVHLS